MKQIDYYTTLSEDTLTQIGSLPRESKISLIRVMVERLNVTGTFYPIPLDKDVADEILGQNPNQLLGLIKGLCDDCQITLISK